MANYIRFWGVRGSYPAPFATHMSVGGNTPCLELRMGEHVVIFDAGTGIIPLGNSLLEQSEIRALSIVLTHYHWDHISGLPFFVPAFTPGWEIDIYAPAASAEELAFNLAQQMKAPYFPVETETWLADISYAVPGAKPLEIGEARIGHHTMHHPGLTYAYRIEVNGKIIVYAPDNELSSFGRSIQKGKDDFDEHGQPRLDDTKEGQLWRGLEFMHGVDLLIHDAQYTPEDYQAKRGWGHSCYLDTVNSAVDADVGELYMFSHEPNYDDAKLEALESQALALIDQRQSTMPCQLARENMIIDLDR